MQDSEAFSESFNSSNVYDEALLDVCQGSEFASVAWKFLNLHLVLSILK